MQNKPTHSPTALPTQNSCPFKLQSSNSLSFVRAFQKALSQQSHLQEVASHFPPPQNYSYLLSKISEISEICGPLHLFLLCDLGDLCGIFLGRGSAAPCKFAAAGPPRAKQTQFPIPVGPSANHQPLTANMPPGTPKEPPKTPKNPQESLGIPKDPPVSRRKRTQFAPRDPLSAARCMEKQTQ